MENSIKTQMKLNRIKAVLVEKDNTLFSFIWNITTDVLLVSDVVTGQIYVAEPQKGEMR